MVKEVRFQRGLPLGLLADRHLWVFIMIFTDQNFVTNTLGLARILLICSHLRCYTSVLLSDFVDRTSGIPSVGLLEAWVLDRRIWTALVIPKAQDRRLVISKIVFVFVHVCQVVRVGGLCLFEVFFLIKFFVDMVIIQFTHFDPEHVCHI